jgi:hypothetical protein
MSKVVLILEGDGIVEGLLHSIADAVVVVLGFHDGDRNIGLVIKDVVGTLGLPRVTSFPLTMIRPLVKLTSSRICIILSQPARLIAGPMNLEQISRSLRYFLFIKFVALALEWALGDLPHGRRPYIYA